MQHPFAAGLTLAEFSAVSTDKDWKPTFVQNSAEGIHKLARLESLAAYWDTDADSLAGHELSKAQQLFNDLIAREGQIPDHQFILKPVSGAGRLVMRRKMTNDIPKMDAQLLFDQLGFALDDEQYRDVISVTDLFHFFNRQAQYRRFRPAVEELEENRPRAMLHFAGRAILNEVHEKHKVWSWDYFRQRRDDRREYVRLFMEKEKQANKANQNQAGVVTAQSEEGEPLKDLEKRLSYKDIRFYRSIARNELRKEKIAQRKDEIANGHSSQAGGSNSASGGWLGWIWGGGGGGHAEGSNQGGVLNDEQRKELYDAIEWDEESGSTAIGQALDLPGDAMKLRLTTKLQTGSFALHDHSKGNEIISLVFDSLQADVIQRIDNLEAALSLGGLRVYDGTSPQSLYPQIVRVKDDELGMPKGRQNSAGADLEQVEKEVGEESDPDNPFFALRFENKPLDKRADNALSLKMRSLEIIYHRGYVEEIVRFFKPPESELELIGALIDVASETLEGIRKETRTGLEHALETHKTIDLDMDVKAPIIIVPEDVTKRECQHIVLDAGKISLKSVLADQGALDTVRSKQSKQYTEEDYRQLEDLMYDRFFVKLESAQLVMGPDLASCMKSLHADSEHDHAFHLLERINLDFTLHNSILPKAPNLTKFKMTGHLPSLRVNFSDRKYKTLMAIIDVAIPQLGDSDSSKANSRAGTIMELSEVEEEEEPEEEQGRKSGRHSSQPSETFNLSRERRSRIASQMRGDEYVVEPASEDVEDDQAEFQDAEDATADRINAHQKNFELHFVVDRLSGSIYKSNTDPLKPDRLLVEAVFEGFLLHLAVYPYHLDVDVGLRSLELEDKIVDQGAVFKHLITSKQVDDDATKGGTVSTETEPNTPPSDKDLVRVKYTRVQTDSPEFMSVYEGIDQTINVDVSTINIMLTRVSVLAVYDWIMTTFVPAQEDQVPQPSQQGDKGRRQSDASKTNRRISIDGPPKDDKNLVKDGSPGTVEERKEKIRVRVKLTSVVLRLNNDGELLATLTLSTADVAVLLRGNTLRVAARLGSLLLLDNSQRQTSNPEFKKLLSIEGDELADFTYETFDAADKQTYPGYDMAVWLRTGSLRFTFLEEPVHDLIQFFSKFAQMKAVYDAATQAASAQATQLQAKVMKLHYDVIIKTPIVVLPRDVHSSDVITAYLGEIYAHNTFPAQDDDHVVTKVEAGIRHIRLASRLRSANKDYRVQMIDDVNISVDMTQQEHVDHEKSSTRSGEPDMQIRARMSDVQIKLTEQQYGFIIALSQSIPRAFAGIGEEELTENGEEALAKAPLSKKPQGIEQPSKQDDKATSGRGPAVDMLPELGAEAHDDTGKVVPLGTTLDLLFNVRTINLELFSAAATGQESLSNSSLARFALNGTEVKLKMLSDSSLESEVVLKSFTVTDTRPGKETKFREIIPAVKHDGYQFMLSYSMSGAPDHAALALITVDSPKVIFSLDPMFALLNFFMSAFQEQQLQQQNEHDHDTDDRHSTPSSKKPNKSSMSGAGAKSARNTSAAQGTADGADGVAAPPAFSFRLNVVDPTIILLAAPERSDTEAIVLSIKQVLMSQQGVLALMVDQFGMFMCRMNKPKDSLRLVDNFNIALSLDSRGYGIQQSTSIELNVQPLIFRVSLRDMKLITSVINKAIELSSKTGGQNDSGGANRPSARQPSAVSSKVAESIDAASSSSETGVVTRRSEKGQPQQSHDAQLIVSKETLKADFERIQLILIGDTHSLPLLDLTIEKFGIAARDWSADLRLSTSIGMHVNYYNLSRSHWEPLIDPWLVDFGIETKAGTTNMMLSSKRRLELNITTTLVETAMTTLDLIKDDANNSVSANRNAQAPFRICNRTGYRLSLWAQHEGSKVRPAAQHLDDGSDMPWRFEDWKNMREHIMESGGNLLSLHIEGMPWERVKHISVDREGEFLVNLRPKLEKVSHRLLYEVKLVDNVKVVTFRSTFNVENNTMVPIEMVVLDAEGKLSDIIRHIAPGESCPVPIEAAYHNRIKLRPDPGFEYGWSNEAVNWHDLIKRATRVLTCNDSNETEAPFRFQCYTVYDRQDPVSRTYPRLTLRVRAPVEVENLLPYDIQYRIFDKNHNVSVTIV